MHTIISMNPTDRKEAEKGRYRLIASGRAC